MPSIASTESGSQGRPINAFISGLSYRRLLSFRQRTQRRRHALPQAADHESLPAQLEDARKLESTTPNSQPFGAIDGGNEQHPSRLPLVQVADQPTTESDRRISESLCIDVAERELVASTSQDTAGGVVQHMDADAGAQKECETPAISKEKPNAMRSVLTKPQRSKTRRGPSKTFFPFKREDPQINQSITTASQTQPAMARLGRSKSLFHFKRKNDQINQPITMAGQTQPVTHSSVCDKPPHSGSIQCEDQDLPVTTLCTEGDKPQPADAEDVKQTARESEEIERLRRDLAEARSQVAELQKRCEAQSKDLENSNGFLNATDKSSDSDVINALQRLNAEVQQSTTYMADCLAEDLEFRNVTMNQTEEQFSATQRASEVIGQVLAKSLGTKLPENLPMLLQIAFQAFLASALGQTASSWVFEPVHNRFINAIYQSLRGVEAQAVSGRWRSLARFHIVHNWVSHPEGLVNGIITGFSDILLAAGCTAPQSDILSKVTSKFEQKIALLVELASRLNKLFDEIISSDFEILVVRPGDKFESKNMEDTDGDQAVVQDASVLCATHLGLIKRMPVGTLWEKGRKQKMMVLKAKVVLESFLDTED